MAFIPSSAAPSFPILPTPPPKLSPVSVSDARPSHAPFSQFLLPA